MRKLIVILASAVMLAVAGLAGAATVNPADADTEMFQALKRGDLIRFSYRGAFGTPSTNTLTFLLRTVSSVQKVAYPIIASPGCTVTLLGGVRPRSPTAMWTNNGGRATNYTYITNTNVSPTNVSTNTAYVTNWVYTTNVRSYGTLRQQYIDSSLKLWLYQSPLGTTNLLMTNLWLPLYAGESRVFPMMIPVSSRTTSYLIKVKGASWGTNQPFRLNFNLW